MDIKLEKKPWYIRYRYYLTGGLLFISFLIYVIVLSLGPRKFSQYIKFTGNFIPPLGGFICTGSDTDTLRLQIKLLHQFTDIQFKIRPALFHLRINQVTVRTGYPYLSLSPSPI